MGGAEKERGRKIRPLPIAVEVLLFSGLTLHRGDELRYNAVFIGAFVAEQAFWKITGSLCGICFLENPRRFGEEPRRRMRWS